MENISRLINENQKQLNEMGTIDSEEWIVSSFLSSQDSQPTLVLDLDETLIFCASVKPRGQSLPIKVGRRRVYIQPRPGLQPFLAEVSKYYDIFFFTASKCNYANKIIDAIWPNTPRSHRFFRDSCKSENGYLVKDLSVINRQLSFVLLVDDIEGSALLQPNNLIRISPFYGDMNDNVLLEQLLPLLKNAALERDIVRAVQQKISQSFPSELFISR
ncbi:NLI interacting factor-like phosphatase family protein [Tritrichomonas foetus]|uniref:Mitochondrial import inner membrane translocase subunit TIM50 n=1 Tax=Tritrichomonas foetus TaxID=1144522 RepID=A0A1J4JIF1_9EUKA|nr:NLI interacting factor-like phosphatase family protein [Tritrichomonas foetus]|eukprot:OHS98968.1 NLI interacting factor-like phosphatase family protein [Tritrichomonas foetus]